MKRAVLVLVVVALAACGGDDGRTYPESVRDSFLVACAQTGGSDEGCECGLEAVEQAFTLSEFTALEQQTARTGELPQGILDAMRKHCGTPAGTAPTLAPQAASVATTGTTAPGDELQAAIDHYKALVADDSADPYGTADGVHRDPDGGRWVEVNRDTSCSWSVVDYGGAVVDSGQGDVADVPAQVAEFRTEPRCAWAYLPEP